MLSNKDLAQKTMSELNNLAATLHSEIRDLRFKVATRQHAKVRNLRHAKQNLARVLTVLSRSEKSALQETPTV